jgi:hypothetical protein
MSTEVIELGDLNTNSGDSISLNTEPLANDDTPKRSANFGLGAELLMNEKKKDGGNTPTSDINLADLNNLENELNDLADETSKTPIGEARSVMFESVPSVSGDGGPVSGSLDDLDNEPPIKLNIDEFDGPSSSASGLGAATVPESRDGKTWDGYGKFNDIPMNPDANVAKKPQLTREEMLREKFRYLKKLEELEKKGVQLTKQYSMESSLEEMQGEYEMVVSEKEKSNSVKFQGKMLMACITGLEFLNNKFDPFDLKLDGWAEQVDENIDEYDEIFAELHEKYKSKSKIAPEIKLMFQLGGSAIMLHMTNSMFRSSMPNMDDVMRQNPDLMQQFTQAAVNSMGEQNPGFSGFMNNMMNPNGGGGGGSGPPPGVRTGPPPMNPASMQHPSMPMRAPSPPSNRPDIAAGRSLRKSRAAPPAQEGINVNDGFAKVSDTEKSRPQKRPDMKGPSNLNDILSGLKTKQINIADNDKDDADSTISIKELKESQKLMDSQKPKKSKKRPKSEKNVISLDL